MNTTTLSADVRHDIDFGKLLDESFSRAVAGQTAVFTTDAADLNDLNDLYLDSLPSQQRQFHNCSCCRKFIRSFGGLVSIDESGVTTPLMWDSVDNDVPEVYLEAFAKMRQRVAKAKVTGVFLSKDETWGTPEAGGFTHFAVTPPATMVFRERGLTARQTMAKRREDFKNVLAGLADFTPAVLDEGLRIFQADAVSRSEKFIGPLKWLRDLHHRPKGARGTNVLWRAIGAAPEGYCHPRSAVTGTLLEDIIAGMPFDAVKRRFDAKVGGLVYQRPQAAPSAGNIKVAEALVEKLGVTPSLARRFARLDELHLFWTPKIADAPASGGVFGHLKAKNTDAIDPLRLPTQTMTWEKFARTIVPNADEIEIYIPARGQFTAILTAEDPDAPPILKWDQEGARNPLSCYVYHGGSDAARWGLKPGGFAKVTGLTVQPSQYGPSPMPGAGESVIAVIAGAADATKGQGNALFPEIMKSELHGIRSVVEAYSKAAVIGGLAEASACGYAINKGPNDVRFRALVVGAWSDYRIDRWD